MRIYSCARDTDRPSGSLTIDGGAPTTNGARVELGIGWADKTTWVTTMRLSASPTVNASGVLKKGISLPARPTVEWDLADTTYGGSGKRGDRRVYAQFRDAAGNWSKVVSDRIEWVG